MITETITIENTTAYVARPDDGSLRPGLVLIEEIWGLTDHIKDVADRLAGAGYTVIAPELLPAGVLEQLTPQFQQDLFDPEKRTAAQPHLREAMAPLQQPGYSEQALVTLRACVDQLLAEESSNGAVGVIGFCFGGTYSFHLAAHDDRIRAAVPFYGQPPSEAEIAQISCPILAFYGDQDTPLMTSLPNFKENMIATGKNFEAVVYAGTGHAFFNDTNSYAYHATHAAAAWQRTLAFFNAQLS